MRLRCSARAETMGRWKQARARALAAGSDARGEGRLRGSRRGLTVDERQRDEGREEETHGCYGLASRPALSEVCADRGGPSSQNVKERLVMSLGNQVRLALFVSLVEGAGGSGEEMSGVQRGAAAVSRPQMQLAPGGGALNSLSLASFRSSTNTLHFWRALLGTRRPHTDTSAL